MGILVTDIFERVYVTMKISLMFWSMTFLGGVILGIGPAFLAIADLYAEFKWDYRSIEWTKILSVYKKNFKRGNILFYIFLSAFLFSLYNLFLAVQVEGVLFLLIDFLLVILMVFIVITYIYSLVINAQFQITFENLLKLSAISLFANFVAIFRVVILLVMLALMTNRFKGMILFISPGLFSVIINWSFKDWIKVLEGKIT